MEILLVSTPEQNAAIAHTLQSFSRFNLAGIRNDLKDLLEQIGRNDIFNEYTKHDITHIDNLLEILTWIVPKETAEIMTPADWMMIVFAIYFHDAGMVVTKNEFQRRNESDFPAFRDGILNSTVPSSYQDRILSLLGDERERFLYQEFVRTHHAERIKRWICGEDYVHLGVAEEAAGVILKLISGLDNNFKRDLALVCESHHKDDLGSTEKYNPRRMYGTQKKEIANLQYAAILLRTVDLLHVTKDRTPSVTFELATPTDPKSIEEWAKQMSVVAVGPAPKRDESGKVDPDGVQDSILVSATFDDPLGFFSLTEYLDYAQRELRQSHQWAQQTVEKEALNYKFPWRKFDTSQVKALTFESNQFAFELDKPKILRLLTGHTLYSNSDVVVRELIQNSIDATRLQKVETGEEGEIAVSLDTASRTLVVDDCGTGMTQRIIEDHFLNVGSSRYRDEMFIKDHPNFAAISRFGIGILSIFMISDEIEVMTKSNADEEVRNISIRSLNGKYLIRRLKPTDPKVPNHLKCHGTRVKLKMRPGVPLPNIQTVAEFWILFPGCKVTVQTDSAAPVTIGSKSPKEALELTLVKAGCRISNKETEDVSPTYQVRQVERDGLVLAYALHWNPYFKNWSFAVGSRLNLIVPGQQALHPTAICLQGIRVESTSPGFASQDILALSNYSGPNSPATNVARSGLETGSLTDQMFSKIYEIYAEHVTNEINAMSKSRRMPISQAASEGRFLIFPLQMPLPENQCANATNLLHEQLRTIPFLTLDVGEKRTLVNAADLRKSKGFWTVESNANRSAEDFLRRIPGDASLIQLASLSNSPLSNPKGDILGGYSESALVRRLVLEQFEVDQIDLQQADCQANLHWRLSSDHPIWRGITPSKPECKQKVEQLVQNVGRLGTSEGARYKSIVLQNSDELRIEGAAGECGLMGSSQLYIFRGNDIHETLEKAFSEIEQGQVTEGSYAFTVIIINLLLLDELAEEKSIRLRLFNNVRQQISQLAGYEVKIAGETQALIEKPRLRTFNPFRGDRYRLLGYNIPGMVD
jgi:hypothetical protein